MISQTPSIYVYSVDVDDFSVRPALYVKAEALKGDDGREVELRNNGTYIQWRYVGEDDNAWRDLVALDAITGGDGADGADGREVELQVASGYIQWRYTTGADTAWKNLMSLSDLKGDSGEDGREVELQITVPASSGGTMTKQNGKTWLPSPILPVRMVQTANRWSFALRDGYIQWKYDGRQQLAKPDCPVCPARHQRR